MKIIKICAVIIFATAFPAGYCFAKENIEPPVTCKYLFEIKAQETYGALNQPSDVTTDQAGDIYVADTVNNRIVVFDSSGGAKRAFGKKGSGPGELIQPMALAVDSKNKIVYVADSLNYRVQVFKTDGAFISSVDLNSNLEKGAKKVRPIGIAVSQAGGIYVSDADNNYIRAYSPAGKPLIKFGGFGSEDGKLCVPVGLHIDGQGKLYVVDMSNSRLQIFDEQGKFISRLGGPGDIKGSFFKPKDVCVDEKGFIFVSDAGNSVVQIFDKQGGFVDVVGADKEPGLQLVYPFGVFVRNNRLFIIDRFRNSVRVYDVQYNQAEVGQ